MTQSERQQLKAVYVATAMYFDQKIPDEVLSLYIEDLADLPFPSVVKAIHSLRRDPKTMRCPIPSVIRSRLNPEMDPEGEATLIASRIVGCVSKIGPYRPQYAQLEIGHVGWQIVQMEGGWAELCQRLTFDNTATLKSQWRNLAKTLLQQKTFNESLPALENQEVVKQIDFKNLTKDMPK